MTDGAVLSSSSRQRISATGPSGRSRVQIPVDLRYELLRSTATFGRGGFPTQAHVLADAIFIVPTVASGGRLVSTLFGTRRLSYGQTEEGGPYQVTTDACLARNSIVGHCVPCVRVAFGRWNSAFRCSRLQLPSVWCTSIGVTEKYNRRVVISFDCHS